MSYRDEEESFRFFWGFLLAFFFFIFLSLGIAWLVEGNNFFLYKTFAPAQAEVERKVFEQTPSYVNGKIQNLRKMQDEYIQATPEQRKPLSFLIINEADSVDQTSLPGDLRGFIDQLKYEKVGGVTPVEKK